MLLKAVDGILPYISFSEHRVNRKPRIVINGKLHKVTDKLEMELI